MEEATSYGKYQLLRRLAVGGMAEVFLARQRGIAGFEKLLVLKRILPEFAKDPEFVSMFLDEARLAASMSHPNVVQIYDLGEQGGSYFIAMEYVPGPDLLHVMRWHARRNQRVPFELSARIMASVADALAYAHNHRDPRGQPLRLVHRDVTPSNILVAYAGTTKLVDFGIAKAESQSSKTAAGRVKGKTRYLAPEQLLQTPVTGKADVWAAGLCLYELVTGSRPIQGDNELATMKAILELPIRRPIELAPDVPPMLDDIIMRCLVRDPAQRMESADALRRELEGFLRSIDRPSSPSDVGEYLKTVFSEEYSTLEASLVELSQEALPPTQVLKGLPAQGLDVTPSGTSATRSSMGRGTPKSNRRPLIALAVGVAVLAGVTIAALSRQGRHGSVSATTDPAGAQVTVDGAAWIERTPTRVNGLAFGPHVLAFSLEGYEPASTAVTLDDDRPAEAVAVLLKPMKLAPAQITVKSKPAADRIFVDGSRVVGAGPVVTLEVEPGREHTLVVEREDYEVASRTFTAKPGEARELAVELVPRTAAVPVPTNPGPTRGKRFGLLDLDTQPPVEVSLGGANLGTSPLRGVRVPVGEVSLYLVNEGLNLRQTLRLQVRADEAVKRSIVFKKGKLAFDVQPWADVYLGSRKLGTTPFAPQEFYEGSYSLKLVNSEIGALRNVTANVKPGETTVLRFDLSEK